MNYYCQFLMSAIHCVSHSHHKDIHLYSCGYIVANHFYYNSLPLWSLICSNSHEIETIILILSGFDLISSLLVVFVAYLLILINFLGWALLRAVIRLSPLVGQTWQWWQCFIGLWYFSTCSLSPTTPLTMLKRPSSFLV